MCAIYISAIYSSLFIHVSSLSLNISIEDAFRLDYAYINTLYAVCFGGYIDACLTAVTTLTAHDKLELCLVS